MDNDTSVQCDICGQYFVGPSSPPLHCSKECAQKWIDSEVRRVLASMPDLREFAEDEFGRTFPPEEAERLH